MHPSKEISQRGSMLFINCNIIYTDVFIMAQKSYIKDYPEKIRFLISKRKHFALAGGSKSIFWRAWARRKPPGRSSSRDDRSERDRVHWRFPNRNIRWPELTLPHPLWPKAECVAISRACLHHYRAPEKEEDWITAIRRPSGALDGRP